MMSLPAADLKHPHFYVPRDTLQLLWGSAQEVYQMVGREGSAVAIPQLHCNETRNPKCRNAEHRNGNGRKDLWP